MLDAFWKQVGKDLAGKWTARMLLPAFAFWGGGLLAYTWRHGWNAPMNWWEARASHEQVALLIGALIVVAFSAAVMERLQGTIIRLAEGYWPWPLRWLRFRLARIWRRRMDRKYERWNALAEAGDGRPEQLLPCERAEYARLDAALVQFPIDPGRAMPTRLGNVLRASEEYPRVRYGLTANVCWPRLWLLLPESVQEELSTAREQLDAAARLCGWGVLFCIWGFWAWWAVPVGLVITFLAYRGMILTALVYGELVRSAFDLHRFALYKQVHFSLPKWTDDETALGERLTTYLHRGWLNKPIYFRYPKAGSRK
jgi:hypothetical protein